MTRLAPLLLILGTLVCPLAMAIDDSSAQELVQTTSTTVLTQLREKSDAIKADPSLLQSIAEEVVLPHFDFDRMSQRVLGQNWRNATPEQRARFKKQFTTLLIRTYATAVYEYRDSDVKFMPARELGDNIQRIRTAVDRRDGRAPLQVDYDVFTTDGTWKVLDVAIAGISLVVSYRTGFNADIGKVGMDGLIDQLVQHNAQRAAIK